MAIKLPKFIGKYFKIDQSESEKQEIRNLVKKELDKANSNDVIRFNWQQLPYQDKNIRKNFPLGVSFNVLRDFSNFYPVARACIEYRKGLITQLGWHITPLEVNAETVANTHNVTRSKKIQQFLRYPIGKRGMSFSSWIKQILEDLFVIDAVAIYKQRNRRGDVIGYLPIDAATIQLILLEDGTVPAPPAYAYMQKVGIREFAKLTTDDLIYDMLNPRTYNPFGMSAIETLLITITTALKLQAFNLGYLCYDDQTEILTMNGWKYFKDIDEEDVVATRNKDNEFQWQQPLSKYCFEYYNNLIRFKSETVDLFVTPNHRILVDYRGSYGKFTKLNLIKRADWFVKNSKSETQNYLVPTTSIWIGGTPEYFEIPAYTVVRNGIFSGYAFKGRDKNNNPIRNKEKFTTEEKTTEYIKPSVKISIKDWVAFLGLYLAEGWVRAENNQSRHDVYIAQSFKSRHYEDIKNLLEKLPFKFRWQNKNSLFECSDARLWNYLKQFGHSYNKYIPTEIKNYSKELLEILWKWGIKGDGHQSKKICVYSTVSKKLADDYQEILQKIGKEARVFVVYQEIGRIINKDKNPIKTTVPIYKVFERSSTHRSLYNAKEEFYKGKVYSVKVPNGIVYIRRNGIPMWCGNTEGNVPEGFVEVPRDIASSRDQLREWQDAWDSMLAGDPRFQRKLKFLPEGMKYNPTVKVGDMTFERFEKWLLLNCCSVFGVPPSAIGFNFETNRASGTVSFDASQSRAFYSTTQFVKELIDRMIQEDMGYDDLEFNWTNLSFKDRLDEVKVVDILTKGGLMAIDEWRLSQGLSPTGAKDPLMMTPVGPVFVKDIAAQSKSGQLPILPYKPPGDAAAASGNAGNAMAVPNVPNAAGGKKIEDGENIEGDVVEELKKWRKTAINDYKQGKKFRDFKTDVLDLRTQLLIKRGLEKVSDRIGIEKVFSSFIGVQNELPNLELYDEINSLIASRENQNIINA